MGVDGAGSRSSASDEGSGRLQRRCSCRRRHPIEGAFPLGGTGPSSAAPPEAPVSESSPLGFRSLARSRRARGPQSGGVIVLVGAPWRGASGGRRPPHATPRKGSPHASPLRPACGRAARVIPLPFRGVGPPGLAWAPSGFYGAASVKVFVSRPRPERVLVRHERAHHRAPDQGQASGFVIATPVGVPSTQGRHEAGSAFIRSPPALSEEWTTPIPFAAGFRHSGGRDPSLEAACLSPAGGRSHARPASPSSAAGRESRRQGAVSS